MSNRKKKCNNYIFVVDSYRSPSMKRNTQGRYKVGAKTEKEARALLQEAIGCGSITLLYVVDKQRPVDELSESVSYKEVTQEVLSKNSKWAFEHVKPHHCTDCIENWEAHGICRMER